MPASSWECFVVLFGRASAEEEVLPALPSGVFSRRSAVFVVCEKFCGVEKESVGTSANIRARLKNKLLSKKSYLYVPVYHLASFP